MMRKLASKAESKIHYHKQCRLCKPTLKRCLAGVDIPNLGSCEIFVQSRHQSNPDSIYVEVDNVNGPEL